MPDERMIIAMAAMQGLLASDLKLETSPESIATMAFEQADAMLAEAAKRAEDDQ